MSPRLKTGLIIGGAVVGGLCLIVVVLGLLGPAIGNMFEGTVASLEADGAGGGHYYPGEVEEAPAMAALDSADARMAVDVDQTASMATSAFTTPSGTAPDGAQPVERLIIRNGSIAMDVEDTLATRDEIEAMVADMTAEGAFVVSASEYGGEDGLPYVTMAIRVPATRFDEVMDRLAAMAVNVTSRDESARDVTEEYVDLAARLESLETARQRLLAIMEEASVTEELLMAEQQLTQREVEIESIRGRMQYLQQSAALSRIDITLQPYILAQPVDTSWRPAETVRRAFDSLLDGLRGLVNFLITFVIAVLPFLAIFGAIIYGIVRFVLWRIRVRRGRKTEA